MSADRYFKKYVKQSFINEHKPICKDIKGNDLN